MSDPAQPGQPPPPPPPATPPPSTTPPAGGGNWGSQGQTPEWAQQAQNWRPADVAAGPAPGVSYADLVMRIVALVIDSIILSIGLFVVFIVVNILLSGILYFLISGIIFAIGSAAFFVYTWTTMRASPGQKILGLMTVNEADGATLTQEQAIRRWAFLYGPTAVAQLFSFGGQYGTTGLGGLLALSGLIGLLVFAYDIYLLYTTANDPKRQGFHDKQARTVVVKATPAA